MTDALPPLAEQAAAVRALYAAGRTLNEIAAATGLRRTRIYFWLDHEIGPDGQPRHQPLKRRRSRYAGWPDEASQRRRRMTERMWRAAEAKVCEIEARMTGLDCAPADAERDARALAVLARVIRELSALDRKPAARPAPDAKDAPAGAPVDEDARADLARDLDSFRRELARRLDALREDGAD